eukprot:231246_1
MENALARIEATKQEFPAAKQKKSTQEPPDFDDESTMFARHQRESLQFYKERAGALSREVEDLRSRLKKNDLKTTEMVAYLQNEVTRRDVEIMALKRKSKAATDELEELQDSSHHQVDRIMAESAEKLQSAEQSLGQRIGDLKTELEELHYFKFVHQDGILQKKSYKIL